MRRQFVKARRSASQSYTGSAASLESEGICGSVSRRRRLEVSSQRASSPTESATRPGSRENPACQDKVSNTSIRVISPAPETKSATPASVSFLRRQRQSQQHQRVYQFAGARDKVSNTSMRVISPAPETKSATPACSVSQFAAVLDRVSSQSREPQKLPVLNGSRCRKLFLREYKAWKNKKKESQRYDHKKAKDTITRKPKIRSQESQRYDHKKAKDTITRKPKIRSQESQRYDHKKAKDTITRKPKIRSQESQRYDHKKAKDTITRKPKIRSQESQRYDHKKAKDTNHKKAKDTITRKPRIRSQ
ncbi:uncharacterized protein [Penaeus vannamei]|uniref:uncharacterized protein n=1 Tax=Penaeus vannamei TaxID=6689 RepID=UPI00387F9E48